MVDIAVKNTGAVPNFFMWLIDFML
jgi:hypothetical protein